MNSSQFNNIVLKIYFQQTVYDGHFHCGASLITKDYVLTAAHCVRRVKRSKIRIILGDHDQTVISDADAKMRAVSAIIKHRHFDSNTYNHDIALLKLRKPIQYTKNIMPVCLPLDEFDPAGKTGIAVGWGEWPFGPINSEFESFSHHFICDFHRKNIRTGCTAECRATCWSSYSIVDPMSQYEISFITYHIEYGLRWKGETRFMPSNLFNIKIISFSVLLLNLNSNVRTVWFVFIREIRAVHWSYSIMVNLKLWA